MHGHHDIRTLSVAPEATLAAEALVVATFLKPRFRIAISPCSGELQVRAELPAAEPRPRPIPRH